MLTVASTLDFCQVKVENITHYFELHVFAKTYVN